MKSYRPGSLLNKKGPSLQRKKFDTDALRISANRTHQEKVEQGIVVGKASKGATSPTSQGAGDRPIGERREVHDEKTYVAKKNFSNLSNNYSYRMQLQR